MQPLLRLEVLRGVREKSVRVSGDEVRHRRERPIQKLRIRRGRLHGIFGQQRVRTIYHQFTTRYVVFFSVSQNDAGELFSNDEQSDAVFPLGD